MRKTHLLFVPLALLTAAYLPVDAKAETLGRLFFTPAERAALDRARAGKPEESAPVTPIETKRPSAINGYITRSEGSVTVWVDGEPQYRSESRTKLDPSIVQTPTSIVVKRARSPSPGK